MEFEGLSRVLNVYPLWLVIYGVLVGAVLYFRLRFPRLLFWLVIAFLVKDLVIDYALADVSRPRVYWAEHAPLVFWIFVVGVLGRMNIAFFANYVGRYTLLLGLATFLLDFYKDLIENPSVYVR